MIASATAAAKCLVATLDDETIFGHAEPSVLDQAFPLGGRDKTLRMWSPDDWEAAIVERYRNAAEVTRAASAFDASAQLLIATMRRAGVRATGDLFS